MSSSPTPEPLSFDRLRWLCDAEALSIPGTTEIEPISGVVGQETAVDALRFGLETNAPGQNIFVRGLSGTGRLSLVRRLIEEIKPSCSEVRDRCYVHNFDQPDRPSLITLPAGKGQKFRREIDDLITFIRQNLGEVLSSENLRDRRAVLDNQAQRSMEKTVKPFDDELRANNLTLVSVKVGQALRPAIFPMLDGKAVPPEQFEQMQAEGQISETDANAIREHIDSLAPRLEEIGEAVQAIQRKHRESVHGMYSGEVRAILKDIVHHIRIEFIGDDVQDFLHALIEDVVEQHPSITNEEYDFTDRYRVNVLVCRDGDRCPVIVESSPTLQNMLGSIDRDFSMGEMPRSDHLMIRTGSLLQADGGYLVVDARDLLGEPGAWKVLLRTLRSGKLEIVPPELAMPWMGPSLKPQPIDVQVKVVLIGDATLYYMLDAYESEFSDQFKVLADFDTVIQRDRDGVLRYAGVLARIVEEEDLLHFDASAVSAIAEHGARIAARRDKLTARFGRLADIAREAAFIARRESKSCVTSSEVEDATRRTKQRANLPARRFREAVAQGSIRIETDGWHVGQINGLAVMQTGPLTYGFPSRITATIGPGTAGTINIEREAQLSGAIHTKGFYILGGLLRTLLRTEHPLAFSASIAFEQSYGGIDGDSASGAEICCLLSALTDVPIRQDLAMTGAIDQIGNILPIGAVNEKIEGFFDTCRDCHMNGQQGVIIPHANVGDLQLRQDVVDACRDGRFHVYSVATIKEAITLFTAHPAEEIITLAVDKAGEYWQKAMPRQLSAPSPWKEGESSEASQPNGDKEF